MNKQARKRMVDNAICTLREAPLAVHADVRIVHWLAGRVERRMKDVLAVYGKQVRETVLMTDGRYGTVVVSIQ